MSSIIYEVNGHVARIKLNRPESRNALSGELVTKLGDALDRASCDPDVHVVVISGNGDKAFSAGFDLKESICRPPLGVDERRADTRFELDTWLKIWDMPKPVIAQVHGYCIGGAFHLALMCDLIIAADNTKFGEPEIGFSFIPDILIEPWKMPFNKAREIMYLGEMVDASELQKVGTVNKVVAFDKLEEETMNVADRLAKMPPSAIRMLKYQLNKTYEIQGFKNSMDFAAEMFNLCRMNQTTTDTEFNEIVKTQGLKAAIEWKSKQNG